MERLTDNFSDYCTQFCPSDDMICCEYYKGNQEERCWKAIMYERLQAYEDTGLEPEEVKEITSWSYGPFHKKMGDWLKAEQEGRLVVLPCKVGDTVWFNTYKNNATECVGIQPHEVKRVNVCFLTDGAEIPQWDIGKTVFLNRDEAEKALKAEPPKGVE